MAEKQGIKQIAVNRQARHEYFVEETLEAGIELFGTGDLLYFAMACAISYLLSGYCGLYSSQTILYSKMRAEFINIHTNENEDRHG